MDERIRILNVVQLVTTFLLCVFVFYAQTREQTLRGGIHVATIKKTTNTLNKNLTQETNKQCLNENELQRNIDHYEQIYIVMPPKAGGSSMTAFARMCSGEAAVFQGEFNHPTL